MLEESLVTAYRGDVVTPAQIRAARALLGWTQTDLARASKVSAIAIKNIERGQSDPRTSTMNAIERALDGAGVIFVDDGDTRPGGPGVRFKPGAR